MNDRPYGGTERALSDAAPRKEAGEPVGGQQAAPAEALAEHAPGEHSPAGRTAAERAAAEHAPAEHATAEQALAASGIDLLGMDLESLRTVEHPVLSALVSDLRERAAVADGEALWGFENDSAAPEPAH